MKRAIYPGTFDPITCGHIEVVQRASHLFDEVVLGIARNSGKRPVFSAEERLELARSSVAHLPQVEVRLIEGLTVDFAESLNCIAIIRGLRAVSDFEYEFQLAQMNSHLNRSIETVFLVPGDEQFFTSSNIVKAVAEYDISRLEKFAPRHVLEALKEKLRNRR